MAEAGEGHYTYLDDGVAVGVCYHTEEAVSGTHLFPVYCMSSSDTYYQPRVAEVDMLLGQALGGAVRHMLW